MQKKINISKNQELILPILWTGKETEIAYNIHLAGIGAKITLLALLLGKDRSNLKLRMNIFHEKPETYSRIIVKGALDDSAAVDFDGLVRIEKGAKGTNAWLGAHILLLSNQAKGRAVPSLEIEENDIKAGHAATIGRVSELEKFYLMSRGLSETTAKNLIVEGFLGSIIKDFPQKELQNAKKELGNYFIN